MKTEKKINVLLAILYQLGYRLNKLKLHDY